MDTGLIIGLSIAGGIVFLGIIFVIWLIAVYNSLIRKRNAVDEAFSNMDVYLNKRYDLIPNLVETVKGYAKHEKETLENVMKARYAAMNAQGGKEKFKNENGLSSTLKSLFKVSENYPDLKADKNFAKLMSELSRIEDEIMNSRKYYNAVVQEYTNRQQTFPSSIVANWFKFERRELYQVEEKEVRKNVKVSF